MNRCLFVFAALALPPVLSPGVAAAAPFADLADIDRAVAQFTGAEPGQAGGAMQVVDRRLRLAPCRAPLAMAWNGTRHDAVLVRCPEGAAWHIYVPVRAGAAGAAPVLAVARGEGVTIAVEGEGFAVSQPGEALEPGALGDWIRVRVLKDGSPKGEPLRARVVRPGLVVLPLP